MCHLFYIKKMIQIDNQLIQGLLDQALTNPRFRQSFDLRNSDEDKSQRLLYALMPGTKVDVHRHPNSNETFVCLCGKVVEVLLEEDSSTEDLSNGKSLKESARYMLDPTVGNFGCVVPKGAWHTIEVLEPSVVLETKDGKYGEDGSETLENLTPSLSKGVGA